MSTIKEKGVRKSILIWFEPMTKSFGFRVANHLPTDTDNSFAWLGIYISPMDFSMKLQTVYP